MVKTVKINRAEIRERLYNRRYLLPNAVTLGAMFCGFLSIIYSSSGRFDKAVIAILLAILLDGLDGRVARRFNATSKFGLEFDSLSDLVSFGVAPAILVYNWCFRIPADEFGVLVCFIYALCAAGRLARFNINSESVPGFEGLPSPASAALIAVTVNLSPVQYSSIYLIPVVSILVLGAAFLMVSRVPYKSIKKIKFTEISVRTKIFIGAAIAFAWYETQIVLFILSFSYCFSGIYFWWRARKNSAGSSRLAA